MECAKDTLRSNRKQCSQACKKIATASRDKARGARKSKKENNHTNAKMMKTQAPTFAAGSYQVTSPARGACLLDSAR